MKILLTKDKNRRNQYLLFEKKRKIFKSILNNLDLPKNLRYNIYKRLINLPADTSVTRVKNRCIITNRPKAVYKNFKMSRIVFRDLALNGQLVGVQKASW